MANPWWADRMRAPVAKAPAKKAQAPAPPRAGMGDLRRLEHAQAGGGIPLQNRGRVVDWSQMRTPTTPPVQRQVFPAVNMPNVNVPQPRMPQPNQARQGVMQGMGGIGDVARRLRATGESFFPGALPRPMGSPEAAAAFRLGGVYPANEPEPYMQAPWWWSRYVYPGGGGY
jgi:hypothetical protein